MSEHTAWLLTVAFRVIGFICFGILVLTVIESFVEFINRRFGGAKPRSGGERTFLDYLLRGNKP